jgi:hypothetical protein
MEKRRNHWVLLWTRKRLGRNDDVKVRPLPAIVQPASSTDLPTQFYLFLSILFSKNQIIEAKECR